jgi:prepilin-type N-terminal cleavage/methylation domain-containing protein
MMFKKPSLYRQSKSFKTKFSAGFTLTELLIVLAIAAVGLAVLIAQFGDTKVENAAEAEGKALINLSVKVNGRFPGGDFSALTCGVLNSNGVFNGSNFNVTGVGAATVVNHKLGSGATTVLCAPATIAVANDAFSFTYQNVPTDACKAAIPQLAKANPQIAVGATVVKTFVQKEAQATYGAQCEAAATVNITVTMPRV